MEPFTSILTHDSSLLRGLRHSLADWLEGAGASPDVQARVVLATHEAVANGIEHGQPDSPVTVVAQRNGADSFQVTVVNDGGWKDQEPGDRGRGLTMMSDLMSDLAVTPSTTVRMRRDS